jgi:hypothetical protein
LGEAMSDENPVKQLSFEAITSQIDFLATNFMEMEDKDLEDNIEVESKDKKVDKELDLPKIPCLCCGKTDGTTFCCLHPSFIKIETLFLKEQKEVWDFPSKWICGPCYTKNSRTK